MCGPCAWICLRTCRSPVRSSYERLSDALFMDIVINLPGTNRRSSITQHDCSLSPQESTLILFTKGRLALLFFYNYLCCIGKSNSSSMEETLFVFATNRFFFFNNGKEVHFLRKTMTNILFVEKQIPEYSLSFFFAF